MLNYVLIKDKLTDVVSVYSISVKQYPSHAIKSTLDLTDSKH